MGNSIETDFGSVWVNHDLNTSEEFKTGIYICCIFLDNSSGEITARNQPPKSLLLSLLYKSSRFSGDSVFESRQKRNVQPYKI